MIDVLPVPKTMNATKILLAVEEERIKAATAKKPGWHQERSVLDRSIYLLLLLLDLNIFF